MPCRRSPWIDCFLTKDGSEITVTVVVVKDRGSQAQAILARPVFCKGRTLEDNVDQACLLYTSDAADDM
eukprot:8414542-Alexandrium_andersonii.AAC.1